MEYWIPEPNAPKLSKALLRLAVRADKLGLAGAGAITWEAKEIKPKYEPICDKEARPGHEHTPDCMGYRRYQLFSVDGKAPQLNGWTFVATLQHIQDAGVVVRVLPGEVVPSEWHMVEKGCDHCEIRRYRRDTYLVRDDNLVFKQVGSTCLKDFLGHESPHEWAMLAEQLGALENMMEQAGYWGVRSREIFAFDLKQFLMTTVRCVEIYGWKSKGSAWKDGGTSTAARVWGGLNHEFNLDPQHMLTGYDSVERTNLELEAQKILDWAQAIPTEIENGGNDYLQNVRVVAQGEYVEFRLSGLAASMPRAYERSQRNAATIATSPSEHVGELKQRMTFVVTLKSEPRYIESHYGGSYLYTFEDTSGNTLKWFKSDSKLEGVKAGDTFPLTGTVKKHDEFRGIKQTLLTRCKLG